MSVIILLTCLLAGAWAAWSLWHVVQDRPVVLRQLFLAGAVEVALVGQMITAGAILMTSRAIEDPLTFWSYLVFLLFVPPVVGVVALVERTKWSSVVQVIGAVTVLAMQVRVLQLWGT